jgi:hypothetical protein
MAPRCTVCAHPQVADIDTRLRNAASVKGLARDFGVTRDSLMRHRDRHAHIRPQLSVVPAEPEPQVRRRNTRTPEHAREDFLDAFRQTGNMLLATQAAGTTRNTVRRWQEHEPTFALEYQQAEIEAVDRLEAEARDRAVKGSKLTRRVIRNGRLIEEVQEWRPSDAILVKLLQALRPEKWGDKLSVTQTTVVKTVDQDAWEAV